MVSVFHKRTTLLPSPVSASLPSDDTARAEGLPGVFPRLASGCIAGKSVMEIFRSKPAAANCVPSGEIAKPSTGPEWFWIVRINPPLALSQMRTLPSALPERMLFPSGEYATVRAGA